MQKTNAAGNAPDTLTATREVLIKRTINAPRKLVFEAWADPDHLKHWYAPDGCIIDIVHYDFREGGAFLTCIRTPSLHDCWCKGEFINITAPEKLVYSMIIADQHGNEIKPLEAGMDPNWPAETIVTINFEAVGNKTNITLHQTVDEALAKQTGAYPSWLSMLDNLEANLTKAL
jgi:uncharacterized protein YndB with AHSA1/START domain